MTALDDVDWPAVYDTLTAGREIRQAEAVPAADRAAVRFAVRILTVPRGTVKWALADATPAGTTVVDLDTITAWLRSGARLVHRYAGGYATPARRTPPRRPAQPGRLTLDERLPALPLIPLAADIAARTGGLTVEARTLGTAHGLYRPDERVIYLDPDSEQISATWAHELSHVLDADMRADADQAEQFAETLGALLLTHQPTTVEQAGPLITQANAAIGPRRTEATDLPADIWDTFAAFLALPLTTEAVAA